MTAVETAAPLSPVSRVLQAIPVIGWIIRDVRNDPDAIWYALVILLTCVVLAVKTWGLVALAMTGLVMVPVMFVLLLMITRG